MVYSECTAVVIVTLGVVLGRLGVMASVTCRFSIPKGAFVFPFRSWMAKYFFLKTICRFFKELSSKTDRTSY